MNRRIEIAAGIILAMFLGSCGGETYTPKPVGYFRIDLPEHSYQQKTPGCPFSFETSVYSRLEFRNDTDRPCWFNIHYPTLNARIHMTYRQVDGNLRNFLEESRQMAFEHQGMANRISTEIIIEDSLNVYGLKYDLGGNVASPLQFYITDSLDHFLRGSLYFEAKPNPDSIQPALNYIKADIDHFISTFRWKNP